MKKLLSLKPVRQIGHTCKTTAIATVDKYFGEKLGFKSIPLHKRKSSPISMRQSSKTKGSLQGELLEARQLSEIFADLGYETQWVDFQENYNSFQEQVTNNIKGGWHQINPLLRKALGLAALLTVIPAIVAAVKVRQGYIGTFFKTPKTDSEEKLESFKQRLNNLI